MSDKKKIFILDDEEVILNSLKKMLVLSGFEVKATKEPKDALAMIKAFKPDLILLDLVMPHLGGLEVCQMLNDDKETQGIPIIIISVLAKHADIEKAYRLGVIGYLTKPYDFGKLLDAVNKALAFKEGKMP